MSKFPFLASFAAACIKLLIPLCDLLIYDTMYIAHAYGSSTNCMSMLAFQAFKTVLLKRLTRISQGSRFKNTLEELSELLIHLSYSSSFIPTISDKNSS